MLLKRELKASVAWHRMQTQRLSLVLHIYYLGSCKMQENELISDNDYTVFFNCTHMQYLIQYENTVHCISTQNYDSLSVNTYEHVENVYTH